jgi:hypothetical protein
LVIAAIARDGKDNADALFALHVKLICLLHAAGIYPASMSADGTEVERSLQHQIELSASRSVDYVIPNSIEACQLQIRLHFQDDEHPFVTVQDSNHARKTGRNQLFSGARLLAIGNNTTHYSQLRDCVIGVVSPLFHRDVEKVDRQDDRAAARLTSSAFLAHVARLYPNRAGLIIYLFVLGEMIDAWQNRVITHLERATMVMMARFVLMAWRSHVDHHPSYSLNIQFISRESYEIFMKICDGLLSLIILHRQFYPAHPLLPWLHGTENCEHVFGVLRQLKTDFNYMDMLYLQPKLRTLLLSAFSRLVDEKDANATAAGYYHSYVLDTCINLHALRQWPTDAELATASDTALTMAEQILSAVGINAKVVLSQYRAPTLSASRSNLRAQHTPREPTTLAELMALYDSTSVLIPTQMQDQIETCQAALVSESISQTLDMYVCLILC